MKSWNALRTLATVLCVCLSIVSSYRGSRNDGNAHNGDYNVQKLRLIYSWKSLEFDYPTAAARQEALAKGEFIPDASLPIDVDVIPGPPFKILVTVPRFQDGVPVTLGYVTKKVLNDNPIIAPYPNWQWNKLGNCEPKKHITNVCRVKVDECGRLWVLDSGKVNEQQVCPAQLLVFDTKTDQLISAYIFPSNNLKPASLLITIEVDIRDPQGQCLDTFVYIADSFGPQLIVYDHRRRTSWNIQNILFYPYPPHGTFTIAGQSFDLMDGLLGLALSPIQRNGDRTLYFHSLASVVESWVPTSLIRNSSIFEPNPEAMARSFKPFPLTRPSQAGAQAMDKNGVLFYGLASEISLGCWNSGDYREFGGQNLETLVVNRETLQFGSGVKIVDSLPGRQELWVLTSAYQKFMNGLNLNETNFRIQAGFVDELVRGTKCEANYQSFPVVLKTRSNLYDNTSRVLWKKTVFFS